MKVFTAPLSRISVVSCVWLVVLLSGNGVAANSLFNNLALMQIIAGLTPLKQIREVPVCLSACVPVCLSFDCQRSHSSARAAQDRRTCCSQVPAAWFVVSQRDGWPFHAAGCTEKNVPLWSHSSYSMGVGGVCV